MAPSNLQGLNIVHPHNHDLDSQDLLSGPPFPDLTAQLDLWTNLSFDSDEQPARGEEGRNKKGREAGEEDDESASGGEGAAASHDGHINVVTGTNLGNNGGSAVHPQQPSFDLNTFLAGFGIDPFATPPVPHSQPATIAPSLSQLLALHSAQGNNFQPPPPPPPSVPTREKHSLPQNSNDFPPSKRTRTRKSSVSTVDSPEDYRDGTPSPTGAPLSAAEDKRRRNTAASARFRLKKKEREAALEGKAKELEGRVSELERECEGLRRENGWLKGLVVGVTGAVQGPGMSMPVQTVGATTAGTKRTRNDSDGENGKP